MFTQINSNTVIHCYRAHEIVPYEIDSRQRRNKKTQKYVLGKAEAISARMYDQAPAYTNPKEVKKKKKKVAFKPCECDDYRPETWDSIIDYYGNENTTQIWDDQENQMPIFQEEQHSKKPNKQRRRSKSHKKHARFVSNIPDNEDELYYQTCGCKCQIHPDEPEPYPATKRSSRSYLGINNMAKVKDKLLCMCRKYSQKVIDVKPSGTPTLPSPSDRPPSVRPLPSNIDKVDPDKVLRKMHRKDRREERKKVKEIIIKEKHESEQTGDAFFQVLVNPKDMYVLNPTDIKRNILKYGKSEKKEPECICPSRGTLRPGEVCEVGSCQKAYKNKQTNFHCWCKKKIIDCGDATCDALDDRQELNDGRIKLKNVNRPLLEVQLDMDKMCVVNPREIHEKIVSTRALDDICSSGVCRQHALNSDDPFTCRCIRKKIDSDITECSEKTCKDEIKMMEGKKKKKCKLSLFCKRLCSKSENWSSRNRDNNEKRIKRRSAYDISPNKILRKMSTQSHNLRKDKRKMKEEPPKVKKKDEKKIKTEKKLKDEQKLEEKKLKEEKKLQDEKKIQDEKKVKEKKIKDEKKVKEKKTKDIPKPKREVLSKQSNPKHLSKEKQEKLGNKSKYNIEDIICACAHKYDIHNNDNNVDHVKRKLNHKMKVKNVPDPNSQKEIRKRAKLDKKNELKAAKQRLREIKYMQKAMDEEPVDTNFFTAFLLGIFKVIVHTVYFTLKTIIYIIIHPKKSHIYFMDRVRDPEGTYRKLKTWIHDAFLMKKLQITHTVRGSDTLGILGDHFYETAIYQTLANKGKTKEEQMRFEQKSKARRRRIMKREREAIASCRHMLLTTLRQTPCLWVYHICPNFYPQCLGLLAFTRSFCHILLFLVAFACWTPCILTFELCRACLCCFMCTG